MRHVLPALVRLATLGLALVAYAMVVVPMMTEPGDPNIGAGLIAFAGLVLASFAWSFVDGLRHGARPALGWWFSVAAALAAGWWVVLAAAERDASMSFGELLVADAGLLPFVFLLIAVPCAIGAGTGQALRRS